jgi:spermidine/putrescine transport system substrate-binding protein
LLILEAILGKLPSVWFFQAKTENASMKLRILALTLALLGLGNAALAQDRKLYIYTWDTYAAPALFKKFEAETGIEVITDIYSSNDTLVAKLKAGSAYDIVTPTGNYVPQMIAENLLQPLPEGLAAAGESMDAGVQKPAYDPAYKYVLPLFYGSTALAVNTKLTKEDVTSWQQFYTRPAGEGPSLGVLDDVGTVMDLASIALAKDFCDASPETFKAMQKLLLEQKPFVKVYGATGYFERLAAGEVAIQMAWSGDTYKVRQQNPDIKYVYPKEGVELWVDNLTIPATAKNVDAARQFIAFALKPENIAVWAEVSGNVPSVTAARALLPEALRNAPEFNIPPDIKTVLAVPCPVEVVKAYNQIWEKLLK